MSNKSEEENASTSHSLQQNIDKDNDQKEPQTKAKRRKISLKELQELRKTKPIDISTTKRIVDLKLGEKK